MIVYVDIDGTIANTSGSDYQNSQPIYENIEKINQLYDEGNTIIYWTARGARTGKDWHKLTVNQLKKWGAKHHKLDIGTKPDFDILIDDKAIKIEQL